MPSAAIYIPANKTFSAMCVTVNRRVMLNKSRSTPRVVHTSARISATGYLHKAARKKRLKCFFPARPVRSAVRTRIHFCKGRLCDRECRVSPACEWRERISARRCHRGGRPLALGLARVDFFTWQWWWWWCHGYLESGCTGLQVRLGLDSGVGSVLGCVSVTGGCSTAKFTLLLPAVSSLPHGLSRYSPLPALSLSFRLTVKHIRTHTRHTHARAPLRA